MFWSLIVIALYIISGALFIAAASYAAKRKRRIAFGMDIMSAIAVVMMMANYIFNIM